MASLYDLHLWMQGGTYKMYGYEGWPLHSSIDNYEDDATHINLIYLGPEFESNGDFSGDISFYSNSDDIKSVSEDDNSIYYGDYYIRVIKLDNVVKDLNGPKQDINIANYTNIGDDNFWEVLKYNAPKTETVTTNEANFILRKIPVFRYSDVNNSSYCDFEIINFVKEDDSEYIEGKLSNSGSTIKIIEKWTQPASNETSYIKLNKFWYAISLDGKYSPPTESTQLSFKFELDNLTIECFPAACKLLFANNNKKITVPKTSLDQSGSKQVSTGDPLIVSLNGSNDSIFHFYDFCKHWSSYFKYLPIDKQIFLTPGHYSFKCYNKDDKEIQGNINLKSSNHNLANYDRSILIKTGVSIDISEHMLSKNYDNWYSKETRLKAIDLSIQKLNNNLNDWTNELPEPTNLNNSNPIIKDLYNKIIDSTLGNTQIRDYDSDYNCSVLGDCSEIPSDTPSGWVAWTNLQFDLNSSSLQLLINNYLVLVYRTDDGDIRIDIKGKSREMCFTQFKTDADTITVINVTTYLEYTFDPGEGFNYNSNTNKLTIPRLWVLITDDPYYGNDQENTLAEYIRQYDVLKLEDIVFTLNNNRTYIDDGYLVYYDDNGYNYYFKYQATLLSGGNNVIIEGQFEKDFNEWYCTEPRTTLYVEGDLSQDNGKIEFSTFIYPQCIQLPLEYPTINYLKIDNEIQITITNLYVNKGTEQKITETQTTSYSLMNLTNESDNTTENDTTFTYIPINDLQQMLHYLLLAVKYRISLLEIDKANLTDGLFYSQVKMIDPNINPETDWMGDIEFIPDNPNDLSNNLTLSIIFRDEVNTLDTLLYYNNKNELITCNNIDSYYLGSKSLNLKTFIENGVNLNFSAVYKSPYLVLGKYKDTQSLMLIPVSDKMTLTNHNLTDDLKFNCVFGICLLDRIGKNTELILTSYNKSTVKDYTKKREGEGNMDIKDQENIELSNNDNYLKLIPTFLYKTGKDKLAKSSVDANDHTVNVIDKPSTINGNTVKASLGFLDKYDSNWKLYPGSYWNKTVNEWLGLYLGVFGNLYVKTEDTSKILTTENYAYYKEYSTNFYKDVLISVSPRSLDDHNKHFAIRGMNYESWLEELNKYRIGNRNRDDNINLLLEGTMKNFPLIFKFDYKIPVIDTSTSSNSSVLIKTIYGNNLTTNINVENDTLYTLDGGGNPIVVKNYPYIPKCEAEYFITQDKKLTYTGSKPAETVDISSLVNEYGLYYDLDLKTKIEQLGTYDILITQRKNWIGVKKDEYLTGLPLNCDFIK